MMKKIIGIILTIILAVCVCVGCVNENATSENVVSAKTTKEIPESVDYKMVSGNTIKAMQTNSRYIVVFEIKQSHFTLDLSEHLKDAMNSLTMEIPVDKEFYDSVEIGDVISEEFRTGSLLMKGSFGKWKVTVANKETR